MELPKFVYNKRLVILAVTLVLAMALGAFSIFYGGRFSASETGNPTKTWTTTGDFDGFVTDSNSNISTVNDQLTLASGGKLNGNYLAFSQAVNASTSPDFLFNFNTQPAENKTALLNQFEYCRTQGKICYLGFKLEPIEPTSFIDINTINGDLEHNIRLTIKDKDGAETVYQPIPNKLSNFYIDTQNLTYGSGSFDNFLRVGTDNTKFYQAAAGFQILPSAEITEVNLQLNIKPLVNFSDKNFYVGVLSTNDLEAEYPTPEKKYNYLGSLPIYQGESGNQSKGSVIYEFNPLKSNEKAFFEWLSLNPDMDTTAGQTVKFEYAKDNIPTSVWQSDITKVGFSDRIFIKVSLETNDPAKTPIVRSFTLSYRMPTTVVNFTTSTTKVHVGESGNIKVTLTPALPFDIPIAFGQISAEPLKYTGANNDITAEAKRDYEILMSDYSDNTKEGCYTAIAPILNFKYYTGECVKMVPANSNSFEIPFKISDTTVSYNKTADIMLNWGYKNISGGPTINNILKVLGPEISIPSTYTLPNKRGTYDIPITIKYVSKNINQASFAVQYRIASGYPAKTDTYLLDPGSASFKPDGINTQFIYNAKVRVLKTPTQNVSFKIEIYNAAPADLVNGELSPAGISNAFCTVTVPGSSGGKKR